MCICVLAVRKLTSGQWFIVNVNTMKSGTNSPTQRFKLIMYSVVIIKYETDKLCKLTLLAATTPK